jgi:subtilisin-like proprotein convertase family protein
MAAGIAVVPEGGAKERLHREMLEIAARMEALRERAAAGEQDRWRSGALAEDYAVLSEAMGGDDPAAVGQARRGAAGGARVQVGSPGPPAPPGCNPVTATFTSARQLPIPTVPAVVSQALTVAGLPPSLWDINLTTALRHSFAADLDVTLMSPAGTVVTITTDNGAGNDDVFDGTLWGDDADPDGQVPYTSNDGLVTDSAYANLVAETPLVPEEALGAFLGEDPNGDWTITISDDLSGEGGTLDSWSLEITALEEAPAATSASFTNTKPVAIPTGPAVVASVLAVAGVSGPVCDVDLTTFIRHTFAADLDVALTSPAGTVVTITTDNGGGNDHVFDGTLWDDDADPDGQVPYASNDGLVTDSLYADLVVETPLVPEEALAAFLGEDPNGDWLLTISDDLPGDGGSLDSWTLEVVTCTCLPPPCPWDTAQPGDPPPGPGTPDGTVGINDIIHLLANWGACPGGPGECPWDTAQPGDRPPGPGTPDGIVGINDLIHLLANWGPCP